MNPNTFAGFNLDDVFKNEEERLRAQREKEQREQHVQELRKKREQAKDPPKAPPSTASASPLIATSYNDLVFEPLAYREQGDAGKKLLYFDKSLERLRAAGFERHARPQEVFGFLIDGLEGRLAGSISDVQKDMLTSHGEWMSMAFERQGNILIAYLDPEGLVWNSNTYVKDSSFKFVDKQEFDIAGKQSNTLIPLDEFSDDLVQAIYGRKFKDLPQDMREGNRKAHMGLPSGGAAWPVGRGNFNVGCIVSGYYYFINVASRGVRVAKNSTGNKGSA
jgi:hypothetical protein